MNCSLCVHARGNTMAASACRRWVEGSLPSLPPPPLPSFLRCLLQFMGTGARSGLHRSLGLESWHAGGTGEWSRRGTVRTWARHLSEGPKGARSCGFPHASSTCVGSPCAPRASTRARLGRRGPAELEKPPCSRVRVPGARSAASPFSPCLDGERVAALEGGAVRVRVCPRARASDWLVPGKVSFRLSLGETRKRSAFTAGCIVDDSSRYRWPFLGYPVPTGCRSMRTPLLCACMCVVCAVLLFTYVKLRCYLALYRPLEFFRRPIVQRPDGSPSDSRRRGCLVYCMYKSVRVLYDSYSSML